MLLSSLPSETLLTSASLYCPYHILYNSYWRTRVELKLFQLFLLTQTSTNPIALCSFFSWHQGRFLLNLPLLQVLLSPQPSIGRTSSLQNMSTAPSLRLHVRPTWDFVSLLGLPFSWERLVQGKIRACIGSIQLSSHLCRPGLKEGTPRT